MVNPLGTFTPSYVNPTYGVDRLASMAMQNGAVTKLPVGDERGGFPAQADSDPRGGECGDLEDGLCN